MNRRVIEYSALVTYSAVIGYLTVAFTWSMFLSLALLIIVPLIVLWYRESLHTKTVVWMALGSFALALLIGVFAYINGLWFETSPTEIRIFGLVPVEALFAGFLHILFYVVLYEYFFDDRETAAVIKHRSVYLIVTIAALALTVGYVYVFSSLLLTYAFAWLVAVVFAMFLFAVLLIHHDRKKLLTRMMRFGVVVAPLSLVYEYVALNNNLRFFANSNEYVYSFVLFEQLVPLEELLFVLLLPLVIGLFYELFFDDEL